VHYIRAVDIKFAFKTAKIAHGHRSETQMMDLSPPAYIQFAQAETPPEAPAVEPTPIKVDVRQYVPENAISVTMIVSVEPPTGTAVVYAPNNEKYATVFRGPRSMDEVRLDGTILYVKLYGATSFEIQYTNYRVP
jgi:hypothetical protein